MDQTTEIQVRWIQLRGGQADGGRITVPVSSYGDIVIHNLPVPVSQWLDHDGHMHAGLAYGSAYASEFTDGAQTYHLEQGDEFAVYVEKGNPTDESQDWDLPVTHPYLEGESVGGRA